MDIEKEMQAFEALFPIPWATIRCGKGYAVTSYSAWEGQAYQAKWEGWLARSKHQEAAKEPKELDGWVKWEGGKHPVADDVMVEVRFSNGGFGYGMATHFDWSSDWGIIAYRVVK